MRWGRSARRGRWRLSVGFIKDPLPPLPIAIAHHAQADARDLKAGRTQSDILHEINPSRNSQLTELIVETAHSRQVRPAAVKAAAHADGALQTHSVVLLHRKPY